MGNENDKYICCLFSEKDPAAALNKSSWDKISEYEESSLHAPCIVYRFLARCKSCGRLLLISNSEYLDSDYNETTYRDIIPVRSAAEAEAFNRKNDGFTGIVMSDRPYLHTIYDYSTHEEEVILHSPSGASEK